MNVVSIYQHFLTLELAIRAESMHVYKLASRASKRCF